MIKSTIRSAAILKVASIGLASLAVAFISPASKAAMIATDNAANYAVSGGWGLSAPNDGVGFGPWVSFATNNDGPPYAGTYLDGSAKNVSTATYSWGTYANSPTTVSPSVDLVREFLPSTLPGAYVDPSGLGTLYGQTLTVAAQTDDIGTNLGQSLGFSLDNGQGASATAYPALTVQYAGGTGSDAMQVTDINGTHAIPITFADINQGLIFSVSVGGNPGGTNAYTLTVSGAPGNTALLTPSIFNGYENGPLQQIDMFDDNTNGNGYFNSLAITAEVPEPASLGLLAVTGTFLLGRRRKA